MFARPDSIRFAPAWPVIAAALDAARIAEPMSVSEAALRYVVLDNPGGGYSGPWNFDRAPYMRRPMDCLGVDSGYWLTAFMGPSQCGKSKIGDIWQLYSTLVDPADIIAVWPDKDIARSYVTSQINKMIRLSPELKARQLQTQSADNIFSKEFVGSNWFHVWPVPAQLRTRPVPRFRVEDFELIPEDVGGEGGVIMLLTGRQTTFEGYEIGYVNSSPSRGKDKGIEALVATGTDERWYVDCPHCAAPFLLAFDNCLHFERGGTAADARESAAVACPDCGGLIDHADKGALMKTGRWVGEGQTAVTGGVEGELRDVRVASFRIDGLAGFASWGRIAELYRSAELTFEATQDEFDLRAVVNSRIGVNYRSRLAGAAPVSVDDLAARVLDGRHALGEVPAGVVCLTAAVDVQGNRFEVLVQGWAAGLESWIIDRFAIIALEGGTTAIDPARRAEHWGGLLQKVIWRRYPVAGSPERTVPIMTTAIDTGGADGVTDNAFAFWYTAHNAGVPPTGVTLIKGGNNPRARLLPPATVDAKRRAAKGAPDAELFVPNVHRFKDIVDVRLRRTALGPGHIHLPRDMERRHLDEMVAEARENGVWIRPPGAANETWDLLVYNAVTMTRLGGSDTSLGWVPDWARAPVVDVIVPADAGDTETAVAELPPPPPPAKVRRRRARIKVRGK